MQINLDYNKVVKCATSEQDTQNENNTGGWKI